MTLSAAAALTEEQSAALHVLRAGRRFLLVGHQRPDGDCIGAQAALAQGLAALGKEVHILNPDPPGPEFGYLEAHNTYGVFERGPLPEVDVVVLLDFNELGRTAAMAGPLAEAEARRLVIDHHPFHGEPWWDAAFVDTSASATGVLVWRILAHLGVTPTPEVAAGVLTSIVTDTGWFRHSNTDAETFGTAAALLTTGLDLSAIYGAIYQRRPATEPRAIAALLARTEYHAEGRIAYVDHPVECGDANHLADSDPVLDILRSVESVEVVLYLRQLRGDLWKLSARSKTAYDVNRLARAFGGGGHAKASGATLQGALGAIKERLLSEARNGF